MNAELEKWIDENGLQFDQIGGYAEVLRSSRHCKYPSPQYVSVDALSELFDGKVPVPVEKWLNKNASAARTFDDDVRCVSVAALEALFDGKVLVPVDALNAVMELAGVALVYQPFGTKDRQHFDTLMQIAASQEQGK